MLADCTVNGNSRALLFGLLVAIFLGLGGWTLKKLNDLSVSMARVEQDEDWIKKVLEARKRDE